MAPLLTEEESALDPYQILGIESSADEKTIKKSYRSLSLKYHPDKNPTSEAAIMFRQIQLSVEILADVAKRAFLDGKLEADKRHKARYAEMDKKRKDMIDSLAQREEEAKKAKVERAKQRLQAQEEEEIKEAGRRLLEEAQRRQAALAAAATASSIPKRDPSRNGKGTRHEENLNENGSKIKNESNHNGNTHTTTSSQPTIAPIDLTLILQFPTSSTLANSVEELQSTLSGKYGPIAHTILKEPPSSIEGKKKKKGKKAIVEFEKGNWGGCWACWKDHDDENKNESLNDGIGLKGVKAKWASGQIPDWVDWASRRGESLNRMNGSTINGAGASRNGNANPKEEGQAFKNGSNQTPSMPAFTSTPSFGSAPSFGSTTMADLLAQHNKKRDDASERKRNQAEYESMTLLKMRQLERDRLAEEIRKQEGDESE